VYNPATGQREIEPFQAEVVRRIFTRFTELRSFDRVCTDLIRDGITTFDGGRWHPELVRALRAVSTRLATVAGGEIMGAACWSMAGGDVGIGGVGAAFAAGIGIG